MHASTLRYVEKHVVLSDFNANFNNFADPYPSLDPAAHHPLSCPNYSWQFQKKISIYMLLFWNVYFYETGFNNRVGTGVGNVSAFKRQLLYNRIGKVSVFVFFIDISIISNTKKMIHLLHTTIPLVFTTGDTIIFHGIRIHSQENMRQYPYRQ